MPWLNLEEDLAEEFDSFPKKITFKEREGFSVRGNFFVGDEERVARRELKRREAYVNWCANYVPLVSTLTRPEAEAIQESEASRAWREARAKNQKRKNR